MRNKKQLYNLFYGSNYDSLYKGFSGFFFKQAHKNLEQLNNKIIYKKKNLKILEIGPGRHLHYDYISKKHLINKYYVYDSNNKNLLFLKKKYNQKLVYIKNLKNIKKNSLDRIICSHVIEHIFHPQEFILLISKLLKKNGSISVTLPCDPGLFWQIGRLYKYLTFWRFKKVSKTEYYYHMALEHVNPIQNLISILRYNFSIYAESYLPLRIPLINFNLMFNIILLKK
jgi:phosphatidylethanolamine/phosphatidyl-N-methylethanolamine N-methyltransferase